VTANWVLGIDFGVVNTAAAVRDPSGQVRELRLSTTGPLMPSAVFCGDEQVWVGHRALAAGRSDGASLEMYPKQRLATDDSKWDRGFDQPTAYIPDLIAAALSEVRQQTPAITNDGIPEQLVLTYPDMRRTSAWESVLIRDGLQAAADLLVCRHCRLLPESTALTSFIANDPEYTAPVVAVDFGATHCHAMVCLRRYDGSYAAMAPRAIGALGAFTVEADVRHWVLRSLPGRSAVSLAALDEQGRANRLLLDLAIRDAIGALSTATSATVTVETGADQSLLRLTREEFDILTRGYVDAAVDLTREMLALADRLTATSTPSVIFLTGSPARNPTLRSRIAEFGFVANFGDPATVVARGAAYHGAQPPVPRGPAAFRSSANLRRGGTHPAADPDPLSTADFGPQAAPKNPRAPRLLAYVTCDDRRCRKSLAPQREHQLNVRIATSPRGGQRPTTDAVAAPEEEQPIELQVDVTSDDGSVHGAAPLLLPTSDHTLASTAAVITFVTGEQGSTVRLNITVLQAGRLLQAAELVAPVNAKPGWADRIRVRAVPLGPPAEPQPDAPKADSAVEHTGGALRRLGTIHRLEIPWAAVEPITVAMLEHSASTVLAADNLATPAGVKFLVDLARHGSRLADKLAALGLTDAHTIALKVQGDSPIVPLELAYTGVAPDDNAQLCECVFHPRARPAPGKSHASSQTVCPYGFWGMSRVITRIVTGQPVRRLKPRPLIGPLSLRPVLYAAADEADDHGAPWALPTMDLEEGLIGRVGRVRCVRVRDWHAWWNAVKWSEPELVVLLGHTEKCDGNTDLIIGEGSRLRSASALPGNFAVTRPAPVVLLCGCTSGVAGEIANALPSSFIDMGAAAVLSTMTSVGGALAAAAAGAVVSAMHSTRLSGPTLATALLEARRQLVARGLVVGLLLVAHGELDIPISAIAADRESPA